MINPQWLELPISRTKFHGPKDVRVIEVRLYIYQSICCGYSFELHRQVDAIQMPAHNICLYKEVHKYTGCNLKTTELLDCVLIEVCAVIRSNTVTDKNVNTAIRVFVSLNAYLLAYSL